MTRGDCLGYDHPTIVLHMFPLACLHLRSQHDPGGAAAELLRRTSGQLAGGLLVMPEALNIPKGYIDHAPEIPGDVHLVRAARRITSELADLSRHYEMSILAGMYMQSPTACTLVNQAVLISPSGIASVHTKGTSPWSCTTVAGQRVAIANSSDVALGSNTAFPPETDILCCLMAGEIIQPWSRNEHGPQSTSWTTSPWMHRRRVAFANRWGSSFVANAAGTIVGMVPSQANRDILMALGEDGCLAVLVEAMPVAA
jgi:hypothetical protein